MEANSASELEIAESMVLMNDGSTFLRTVDGVEERYFSTTGRHISSTHDKFFMDQEFK